MKPSPKKSLRKSRTLKLNSNQQNKNKEKIKTEVAPVEGPLPAENATTEQDEIKELAEKMGFGGYIESSEIKEEKEKTPAPEEPKPTTYRVYTYKYTPSRPYTPAYSNYGPSALCGDGTYSYSSGRGTCSHHGGVAQWL